MCNSWRPFEPMKPEFKYRQKRPTLSDFLDRYTTFEVLANGYIIGNVYSDNGHGYRLGLNTGKTYSLEVASEKLWERYKNS